MKKTDKKLFTTIMLIIVIGVVGVVYWYKEMKYYITTEDAYVQGNLLNISSRISGTINKIYIDTNQYIQKNQKLFSFDKTDLQLQYDVSKNKFRETIKNYCKMKIGLVALEARIQQSEAMLNNASSQYNRTKILIKKGSISQNVADDAKEQYKSALAALMANKAEYLSTKSLLGTESIENASQVQLAKSDVINSWLNLQRADVLSPIEGYVAKRSIQVGQQISTGNNALLVVQKNPIWVVANFKETKLNKIKIGQPVEVIVDMQKNLKTIRGVVTSISPGTGSAFSLIPPENATGNWLKIVQRIPIKIQIQPKDSNNLKIGLSAKVRININKNDIIKDFKPQSTSKLYQTNIYDNSTTSITQLVSQQVDKIAGEIQGCLD